MTGPTLPPGDVPDGGVGGEAADRPGPDDRLSLSPEEVEIIAAALVLAGTASDRILAEAMVDGFAIFPPAVGQLARARLHAQTVLANHGVSMGSLLTLADRLAGDVTTWRLLDEAERITRGEWPT